MNDNHVFRNNDLQEQKEIQLHNAHRRLSSENLSRDNTFKPDRTKLGLQVWSHITNRNTGKYQ